jgi:hypothetical protein
MIEIGTGEMQIILILLADINSNPDTSDHIAWML